MQLLLWVLLLVFGVQSADAGLITRPTKSNGQTSFTNGMVPQDSDLNGDPDTIYAEFNGNIANANISSGAAIAASKINPDGFTADVRTVTTQPCHIWEESDQGADLKRWAACVVGGEFRISTTSDAGATQNDWLKITRANGGFTIGGDSGTNTVKGPTTFNATVTFLGANNILPTGMIVAFPTGGAAPSGWLLMNGASNNCKGSAGVNANLCALLVPLNYRGTANGTVTVDTGTDEIIRTAHGLTTGDYVFFTTTGTLPSPLVNTSIYCIISTTTDRYKISSTCGGGAINITSSGSGTHSEYDDFITPDARGRNIIGTGQGSGLTNRSIGNTGGEELHVLSLAEMPTHSHELLVNGVQAGAGGGINGVNGSSDINKFTENAGSGGAHNVMDPFLVMTYIIKL